MEATATAPTAHAPRTVDAYAAPSAGAKVEPYQFREKPLRPMDVEIAITHCGICHTDLHLINNDFGMSAYPLVPGHEIVGEVSQLGSAVKDLKIGQRVGVGFLAGADFTCAECAAGRDNMCVNWEPTCLGREGGFAKRVVADSRMAFPIPDTLASEHAAPLMCAGVTVFAPLLRHADGASRVGVIGIGGLGHLALQYARAMGCHVTAFTTSAEKGDEARELGAHDVVDTSQPGAIAARADSCDLILSTVAVDVPWNDYLGVLRRNGKLCLLGIPTQKPIAVAAPLLVFFQRSIISSGIGSRQEMRQMLDFSARNGIAPHVELFPMSDVNTALARLSANQLRYRAVLTNV